MTDLAALIRNRRSHRGVYDPRRRPPDEDVRAIIDAAQWAPTAHNMQNFEIVVIDDPAVLAEIGRVPSGVSAEFIRENYAQLSFSEEELVAKGTGLAATMFPPAWRRPDSEPVGMDAPSEFEHGFLDLTMRSCPLVLIVVYDTRKRAPASEGDVLGLISLGCVLENMWLTAESRGIGLQVMSVFSNTGVEERLHKILSIPARMKIAYACRLGYAGTEPDRYLRVRRPRERFVHHNSFRRHPAPQR
ncbi:MAG TPA: nitroreductase family protein [Actinospica sp.]|nr:nitroreductase family protein [Actinospica sp.]